MVNIIRPTVEGRVEGDVNQVVGRDVKDLSYAEEDALAGLDVKQRTAKLTELGVDVTRESVRDAFRLRDGYQDNLEKHVD